MNHRGPSAISFLTILLAAGLAAARATGSIGLGGGLVAAELVGATAGCGLHLEVGFRHRIFGTVSWYPSVDAWMKTKENYHGAQTHREAEIAFNLAEIRYIPPVPDRITVKPYIGLGGMGIVGMVQEVARTGTETTETSFHPGFDIFGGADFWITPKFAAFMELRGKSNGATAFKMFAGLAFRLG